MTTIAVARHETTSSSELVVAVASGLADIASVWDGPRGLFIHPTQPAFEEASRKVYSVKLPGDLPCDLLVATSKVDGQVKSDIRGRLAQQAENPAGGDIAFWVPWSDSAAENAHTALSVLRRQAIASRRLWLSTSSQ